MPDLILAPPTVVEGQTIEVTFHGQPATIYWKDEDTLVIDGDDRQILVTDWDAESIGFAFIGADEDLTALRGADPKKVADALCARLALMHKQAAAERAERIERAVAEVERQKEAELGRPLSAPERAYVLKLVRELVIGRTD
ncbi:MAG TPA: hypothetical protein VJ770_20095 [Stellaceae bacterium]|nr:hypothetical protein [Stellaceae bacterium]